MMNMRGFVGRHEEGVVINKLFASIYVRKYCYISLLITFTNVQKVCGNKVEVFGVPLDLLVKLLYADAEMSEQNGGQQKYIR